MKETTIPLIALYVICATGPALAQNQHSEKYYQDKVTGLLMRGCGAARYCPSVT